MTPDRLLAHFDRLADAPNAVQRLRHFILDLAVRGKLVPQDPDDEPALELVRRTQAQRARLAGVGAMKKQDPLPPVQEREVWFRVPSGWEWVRLGAVTLVIMGQSPPGESYNTSGDGVPLINGPVEFSEGPFGRTVVNQYTTSPTNFCNEGDLLLCVRGSTTGRTNIAGLRACIGRGVAAISPLFDDGYLRLFIWNQRESIIHMGRGVAFPSVSRRQIEELPTPLPPIDEQQRIVARVDELMALCDQLEAAQADRERQRDRLASASLQRVSRPADDDDAEAFQDHVQFHLEHLPLLITRPEHVKGLRETILNLAVRGKLVPQDPNDEPASALLGRIRAAKAQTTSTRAARTDRLVPSCTGKAAWTVPDTWVWAPLGQIMISRDGERVPISKDERSTRAKVYDYYGASGVIDKIDGFLFDKPLLLIGEDGANLVNRSTPIAFMARGKYWVNNHAHVLDGISEEFLKYIEMHINAIDLKPYVTGTAQPKMNQAKMNTIPIALPPEDEQRRIVVKVGELMAICDELERQLVQEQTDRRRFLEAVLHEALTPAEAVREREMVGA